MHEGYKISRVISFAILGVLLLFLVLFLYNSRFRTLLDKIRSKDKVIKWMEIVLSILFFFVPYWVAQYGLDFVDTFFHLNLFREYPESASIAHFGSSFIGNIVYRAADGNVLYMQWVAVLIMQLSAILPIVVYQHIRKRVFSVQDFFIISFFVMMNMYFNVLMLRYDSISFLCLSLILCVLIIYESYNCVSLAILLGILCGTYTTLRFPNVIMTIFVPCILLFDGIRRKTYQKSLLSSFILILSAICVYLLCFYLQFGSLSNAGGDAANMMEGDSSHNVYDMIAAYIFNSCAFVPYVGLIVFLYLSIRNIPSKNKNNFLLVILSLAFITFTCLYYIKKDYAYDNARTLLNAMVFSAILYLAFVKKQFVLSLIVLSCWILPIIGSNTGILKLCNLICLPILIYIFIEESANYKYVCVFAAILIIYLPIRIYSYTIFDDGIYVLKSKCSNPMISNIYTSAERKKCVENANIVIQNKIKEGKTIVCIGSHRNLFDYINDLSDPITSVSQDLEDVNLAKKYISMAYGDSTIHFVIFREGSIENKTNMEIIFSEYEIPYSTLILNVNGNWK